MDQADQQDVAASLRGDGQAYGRLVTRHQQAVAARMWRFTRDPAELEELVHDVFVEAYSALSGYKAHGPFAHWLGSIAVRVGYRFWKRRKRQAAQAVPLGDYDPPGPDAPSALEAAKASELLHGLMDRLPPRDRLVLTLMYLDELPVAAVAGQTGWSETMVKVQAHRARKRLKALIEQSGLTELFSQQESQS